MNYLIETLEGDKKFSVFRRFRDFQVLADSFGSADLPTRGWLKLSKFDSEEFVEERRVGLESFLRKLLLSQSACESSILWTFLETDPETCLVPRLQHNRGCIESLRAVEQLASDAGHSFRLGNRQLVTVLLEYFTTAHCDMQHSALVILRAILSSSSDAISTELVYSAMLEISSTDSVLGKACRNFLVDFTEKFPEALFHFFQRDAGLHYLLKKIESSADLEIVTSEILWIGAISSRDICVALSEKNSCGSNLLEILLKSGNMNIRILAAANLAVLARNGFFLPQVSARISESLANLEISKFSGQEEMLNVLFRNAKTCRAIFNLLEPLRDDGISRFSCAVVSLRARCGNEFPAKRDFGEKLLRIIRSESTSQNFIFLASETFLSVRGLAETLAENCDRQKIMKIVSSGIKKKLGKLREILKNTTIDAARQGEEISRSLSVTIETGSVNFENFAIAVNSLIDLRKKLENIKDRVTENIHSAERQVEHLAVSSLVQKEIPGFGDIEKVEADLVTLDHSKLQLGEEISRLTDLSEVENCRMNLTKTNQTIAERIREMQSLNLQVFEAMSGKEERLRNVLFGIDDLINEKFPAITNTLKASMKTQDDEKLARNNLEIVTRRLLDFLTHLSAALETIK